MAKDIKNKTRFETTLNRVFWAIITLFLIFIFMLWRIDNPRAETVRIKVYEQFVPKFDWAIRPLSKVSAIFADFEGYTQVYRQNQELRREIQKLKSWKEAAIQLERRNTQLLELNNLKLAEGIPYITGLVLTDSGSPFRQSVLLDVGSKDGIKEGWAVTDGFGLVGRVAGIGKKISRVVFLTDSSSRIPVTILPSGKKGIVIGDNSIIPAIGFLETVDQIKAGDRVVTSGDGDVFPPDILLGQVALDSQERIRVRLSANFQRIEFLKVLRQPKTEVIDNLGQLVGACNIPILTPNTTDQLEESGN